MGQHRCDPQMLEAGDCLNLYPEPAFGSQKLHHPSASVAAREAWMNSLHQQMRKNKQLKFMQC